MKTSEEFMEYKARATEIIREESMKLLVPGQASA